MTRWIPAPDVEAPEGHTWHRAEGDPCPNCVCCSKRLCEQALEADRSGDPFACCHFIGRSADFDLAECPCWRDLPGGTPTPDDHRYRRGATLKAAHRSG